MTGRLIALAALALLLAACGSTRTVVRTVTVSPPQRDVVYVGHIVSMTRSGGDYLVRFDPQFDLLGITANVAAAEDMHVSCAPRSCQPVPNDVYSIDETHRAFTFLMPLATKGTVLTTTGTSFGGTQVSASQLAAIVAGRGRKLFEPLLSGVKITVRIDTITSFAQQYRP
jgi:hypothetical protein